MTCSVDIKPGVNLLRLAVMRACTNCNNNHNHANNSSNNNNNSNYY